MAKNIEGLEKGDILVAMGKAYLYADPNDAALDKEVDTASEGLKFGVATGVTKKGNDGFSYTEMVAYFESNRTDKFDLGSSKYYVLQATYSIEENPDYDYSLNKKKTIGTVATGVGTGFNKFIELLSGVFGIVQANKAKKDAGSNDTVDTDNTDNSNNTDTTQQTWFQKNKFTVILGGLIIGIIAITVWIVGKNKKKAKILPMQAPAPTV